MPDLLREVLEDVSFGVTPDSGNVYEAGKEVYFNFSGNPDYITFYSGEVGHKYEYAGKIDGEGTANYGIPVKAMNARADNYSYIYETAGEYDAVFVARNATFEGESKVVARLKITIAEPADNE
ncbi:MAG: DUF5017 domain-containing protein [Alistipes onderdonkii]